MKFRPTIIAIAAFAISIFSACDSDTGLIGSELMPQEDSLSTFHEFFDIKSKSVLTGPVVANTSNCLIGSIIDPETGVTTTSSYLAQFHIQEDYTLPDQKLLIKNDNGEIVADSCVIRIFHDKFYGDSLTTMKLTAIELSHDKIMSEGKTYYTDINPEDYLDEAKGTKASATYTVIDQNLSSFSTNLSSGNYRCIPVNIGADYGTYILRKYYEDPSNFKNSHRFIHNICPGFYIKHSGGVGSLVNSDVTTLDVYYRYQDTDTTVANAWIRLGATQEVIQNTRFDHEIPQQMLDESNEYSYIKSPAGIHTELTLPIDQIASGEHYRDTLNSARFTLRQFVSENPEKNLLNPPSHLLLIRKGYTDKKDENGNPITYAADFFANNSLPDNVTSFLCEYNSTSSVYSFTNIAPLIAYIRKQRDSEAMKMLEVNEGENIEKKWDAMSPAEREPYWKKWEESNPDWQKFELLPVTALYTTSTGYYGTSSKTLVGLQNDFNLHSVKLEGGANSIKLNVIYSRFSNKGK